MKMFSFALAFACISLTAVAGSVNTGSPYRPFKLQLSVNTYKASAEVLYTVSDPLAVTADGWGSDTRYSTTIPGLSYNKITGEIQLETEGKIVVCAHVNEHGPRWFRFGMVHPTGDCVIKTKSVGNTVVYGLGRFSEPTYTISVEAK